MGGCSVLQRVWRFTGLVVVGLLLAALAQWRGCPVPTNRQVRPRAVDPQAIVAPPGWRAEAVLRGLDAPADMAWGPDGALYIAETGFAGAYASTSGLKGTTDGRILHWQPGAPALRVHAAGFVAPLSGLAWHGGTLYASHRNTITALGPGGLRADVVTGLPSYGDHGNNHIAFGPDGYLYMTQGTATNTAVVGLDNFALQWAAAFPGVHDIPCRSVRLSQSSWTTGDPRALLPLIMRTRTGGFQPFGMAAAGQVVQGRVPCNGAVLRARPDGSGLEVVAWGLRNPFGIGFDPAGRLFVTDNAPDGRGSRPMEGAPDLLRLVRPGTWHGWPDRWAGLPIGRRPVLAQPPGTETPPVARLAVHAGAAGLAIGPDGAVYIAQAGSAFPATTRDPRISGFNVVRVDPRTGREEIILRNRRAGPQSWDGSGGFERPVAVRWGPDGALWVLDYGRIEVTRQGPWVVPQTGVLWRFSRTGN